MIRRFENPRRAIALAALAGLAAACSGGGGGGGPSGPDVTPPGIPVSSLIVVDPPIPAALARLTGAAGAVEGSAVVNLANPTAAQRTGQPVTATAQASAQGAFTVSVAAQLGDQLQVTATDAAGNTSGVLSLKAGPTPLNLNLTETGANNLTSLATGEGAFNLQFPSGSERYALVAQSLNPGAGSFPLTVSGSAGVEIRSLAPSSRAALAGGPEAELRESARRAVAGLPSALYRGRGLHLSDDPAIGSTRMFNVVNRVTMASLTNRSHFDLVTARLRYKGAHTLIYVDTRAEGPNVTDVMLQQVGDRFDDETYAIDRDAFGLESDVDGNDRVIILLTPTVNALTEDPTDGVLTGFFYVIDLVFDPIFNPYANDAEIFYSQVPDPTAQFGGAEVPVAGFDDQLHAVLAHEFEHMINAGQRLDDLNIEVVWLDEGMAHYAETLNGVEAGGSPDLQNVLRAALWLERPSAASLVGNEGTLVQRGAAWLLVAYLVDHYGQGILRELAQGPLTGIPNVEDNADTSFPFLFYRFTGSLLLDGSGLTSDPWFDFPSVDLRARFAEAKDWFLARGTRVLGPYLGMRVATVPGALGSSGTSLVGSSAAFFDIGAATAGSAPVVVRASPQANLQVTIIRTQ